MTTKIFEANGKRYEVAMATAVKQDELLSLIAQRMFIASGIAQNADSKLNENSVMIALMTMQREEKEAIAKILTEQAIEIGTTNNVSIKDFEGNIVEWNRFIARLIMWNLGDFFVLLASENLEKMMRTGASE